jgi:hypothetical protein
MDAEKACALKPEWDKAWWRKATALNGLKQFSKVGGQLGLTPVNFSA